MWRKLIGGVVLIGVAAVAAAAVASTGGDATRAAKAKPLKYAAADLFIETNATDGDIGLQLFMDAEPWDSFKLYDPNGRKLIQRSTTEGRLKGWGLTEYFFETDEPSFDEVPIREFKKQFPAGTYTFRGRTVDGRKLVGSDRLSHLIPAGPTITSPAKGAVLDRNSVVVSWEPVTRPAGVEIASYELILEIGKRDLDLRLPPEVTTVSIPPEFLTPGAKVIGEVLAKERSGNQTITHIPEFTTR
jgi:hypothetical protein